MKESMALPDGWTLFDSKEKEVEGDRYFYNRYIHKKSKSGIVYYSTKSRAGKKYFVVEGYGIGTIDPRTFKEITDSAPIQRHEKDTEEQAEKALFELMKENAEYFRKEA